jgi:glycosyltransferase involved in cell wall biosynthesis
MVELAISICVGLATVAAGIKLQKVLRNFQYRDSMTAATPIEQLPTVSLCIPARDETHAMTDCLQRALASDYPKLEIIVLDDGSRDDTSLLIKSFAHAGVRFVEGKPLAEGWLGKNYALEWLSKEASGDILLFADVDTRLETQSISKLVQDFTTQNLTMLSVLPQRADEHQFSNIMTTLRQFWALVFYTARRPAVASNLWMVHRSLIIDTLDGLSAFKQAIRPEVAIARHIKSPSLYRFIVGSRSLGVSYEKRWSSQIETSTRLAFPLLGRNIFKVIAVVFGLSLLLVPYVSIVIGIVTGNVLLLSVALLVTGLQIAVYGYYLAHIRQRGWSYTMFLLPIIIAQEIYMIIVSTIQYLTKKVTWKGRPVQIG